VDLVDVDADGDLDLFIAEGTDSPAPRPNRLFLNDGDGEFFDVSATHLPPGLLNLANSTKVDFGDLDGDGDLDAIVANLGPEQLLLNDGAGVFVDGAGRLPPPAAVPPGHHRGRAAGRRGRRRRPGHPPAVQREPVRPQPHGRRAGPPLDQQRPRVLHG
jgi:hypothetical protein